MVASILKIVITRNSICDILVGLPKSGHIFSYSLVYVPKIYIVCLITMCA